MSELSLRQRIALELARKMRENNKAMHVLKQLFWECTLRCNLNCKHCGSDCKTLPGCTDMPAKDFLRVIDSITPHVNPHDLSIIITGGEPLVRNDIEAVGLELYHRGYPWGIVTNGLFLTRKRLAGLMAAGMHGITVSLDGFEDDNNWMRGHTESYARALNAIKMLVHEPELEWDVVTCVNRKNYHSLKELRDYLYKIGVRNWRIFTIFPVGRAAGHAEFQLTDEEFVGLMEFIKTTRKEKRMNLQYACEGFLNTYEGEVRDGFYSCIAGINVASILSNGSISACLSIRSNYYQGNIYRDDFMDVWNNRFQPFRNRDWMKTGDCGKCKLFRYCEGNGMHLRDGDGKLLICHQKRILSV